MDLFMDVVLQVIVKNIMFKNVVMVFNFIKKESITRLALSRNMKNAV